MPVSDNAPRSVKRLDAAERMAAVVQMRREFLTFEEIGQRFDPPVTKQRVQAIYKKALVAIPSAVVDELRIEQTDLADRAIRDLLGIVDRTKFSDPRAATEALRVLCTWSERLSRLHGLDAPLRAEFSNMTADQLDREIHRLEIEVAAQRPMGELEAAPADRADDDLASTSVDADADTDASSDQWSDHPERGHFIPALDPAVAVRRRALEQQSPDWSSAYRQQPAKPADGAS